MKPRQLGISIVVISIVVIGMLVWFNSNLNEQKMNTCDELCNAQSGSSCSIDSCPFNGDHNNGDGLIFVMGLLIAFIGGIGFYLSFSKVEKLVEHKEYDISKLNKEEKNVFLFVKENKEEGVYQSNIVEHFDFPKTKVTRILDKLERSDLIERKRRGMSNIIFLK